MGWSRRQRPPQARGQGNIPVDETKRAESEQPTPRQGAMQYPQLILGMLAIFTYVGVEVTIQTNLGELLKFDHGSGVNPLGLPSMSDSQIAPLISMYWGGLMIGRWAGAIAVFNPV